MTFKLPEPAILMPEGTLTITTTTPMTCPLYTESQMLQLRRDTLEEAAKLCEAGWGLTSGDASAAAIRKLKDET
jgi:hypothetical protein